MYVVSTQQQQQVGPERVQPETTFPPFHQTHPVFSLSPFKNNTLTKPNQKIKYKSIRL
jgi:hypothetical protein